MRLKVLLSLVVVMVVILSITTQVDFSAAQIHDQALQRALAAFGIAKALNGVISLIQGTELSVTPIGIGLTFSVAHRIIL